MQTSQEGEMCDAKKFITDTYGQLRDWLHENFFVSRAILYISGLLLSYKLVDKIVVSVFVFYFMDIVGVSRIYKAAMLSILQEFMGALFTIVAALISDSSIGIFKLIIFSSAAYAIGLWYLFLSGRLKASFQQMGVNIFVMAQLPVVVPIAFAAGGKDSILGPFLREQLKREGEDQVDENTMDQRQDFWFCLAGIFSGLLGLFIPHDNWGQTFLISAIAMTTSSVLLLLGKRSYRHPPRIEKPYVQVFKVFKAAISKWGLEYPREPAQLRQNFTNKLPLGPPIPFSRWLDKAAVIEPSEEEGNQRRPCTAREVTEVKFLLKVLPLWISLVVLYLVYEMVALPFFFISCDYYENTFMGIKLSCVSMEVARKSLYQLSSFLYDFLVIKQQTYSKTGLRVQKMKVGVGILSHILCYFIAWKVEAHRLRKQCQISMAWLFPQFLLFGLGEGLVLNGFGGLVCFQYRLHLHSITQDAGRRYKFLLRFVIMFSCSGFAFANLLAIVYIRQSLSPAGIRKFMYTGHCEDINLLKYYKVLIILGLAISCFACGILLCLYRTDEKVDDETQNPQGDTNVPFELE